MSCLLGAIGTSTIWKLYPGALVSPLVDVLDHQKSMVCLGVTTMYGECMEPGRWFVMKTWVPPIGDPNKYRWWRFAPFSTWFLLKKPLINTPNHRGGPQLSHDIPITIGFILFFWWESPIILGLALWMVEFLHQLVDDSLICPIIIPVFTVNSYPLVIEHSCWKSPGLSSVNHLFQVHFPSLFLWPEATNWGFLLQVIQRCAKVRHPVECLPSGEPTAVSCAWPEGRSKSVSRDHPVLDENSSFTHFNNIILIIVYIKYITVYIYI